MSGNEQKWTPGPWYCCPDGWVHSDQEFLEPIPLRSAWKDHMFGPGKPRHAQAVANAHLIATAPEMDEALELAECILTDYFNDGRLYSEEEARGVLRRIKQVRAKARGKEV